jgi:flagellar basal-body rod modification protein FlgD
MSTYGVNATQGTTQTKNMNKDAFLQLLVTQMKYQDPLEPAKNEAFLAQMAQFSSLEQMQNLNTSSTMQQAYSLIGRTVLGQSFNDVSGESKYVQGVVQSVTLKNGEAYLNIDGVDIKLSKVDAVLNTETKNNTDLINAIAQINETLATIKTKIDALTTSTLASGAVAVDENDGI